MSKHDGFVMTLGRHFESKEELNLKLSLIVINKKFEMKMYTSRKTLKELKCVDDKCYEISNSNFFVICQYNGFHY